MGIAKNALSVSSARLLAKGLGFVATILVARHLARNLYGEYSLVAAFALIFSYLADFGLVSLIIRQVAQTPRRTSDILGEALPAQLGVSVLSVVALMAIGLSVETDPTIRIGVVLAGGGLFVESLGRPFSGVLIGQQRLLQSALVIATVSLFNTAALLLVLAIWPSVLALIGVAVPVGVLSFTMPAYLTIRRSGKPLLRFSRRTLSLLQRSFPFALLAGSAILYDRLDVLILSHLAGNGAVGIYSAADRVIEGLLVLPAGIGAALYPALASNLDDASRRLRSTLWWAVPLGAIVAGLAVFPGGLIVSHLYGSDFAGSGSAFQLLAPTILFEATTVPLAYLLQARDQTRFAVLATGLGLVVNVSLNLILIPRLSFRGAAMSATLAELSVLLVLLVLVRLPRKAPATLAIATVSSMPGLRE